MTVDHTISFGSDAYSSILAQLYKLIDRKVALPEVIVEFGQSLILHEKGGGGISWQTMKLPNAEIIKQGNFDPEVTEFVELVIKLRPDAIQYATVRSEAKIAVRKEMQEEAKKLAITEHDENIRRRNSQGKTPSIFSWHWVKEHPWHVIGVGFVWNMFFPPAFTFPISLLLVWIAQDPRRFHSNLGNLIQAIERFFAGPR
jgi:hypothetical protein